MHTQHRAKGIEEEKLASNFSNGAKEFTPWQFMI